MSGAPGPRITIFGTGAMGCLLGARLARAGARVTLVGTWREALAAIGRHGIRVEDGSRAWSIAVATARIAQPIDPAPIVLVLVKSHQTRAVAPYAARAVTADGIVVTLQNGLGNREILEGAAGASRVAAGVVTAGATLLGAGHVSSHPGAISLGNRPSAPALGQLAALLADAGFETELRADLERLVWRKLAVNCAINPLSAVRALPNGALLARSEDRELLAAAAREVQQVAAARGVDLGTDAAELARGVARRTGGNRSSMLQDVERGAPTEIDALNGAVIREGRRLGVPTPVNEWLCLELARVTTARRAGAALRA
jgi:2-dehydropantoate 2-reductase